MINESAWVNLVDDCLSPKGLCGIVERPAIPLILEAINLVRVCVLVVSRRVVTGGISNHGWVITSDMGKELCMARISVR